MAADGLGVHADLEVEAGPLHAEADLSAGIKDSLDDLSKLIRALRWGLRPVVKRKLEAGRVTLAAQPAFMFIDVGGPKDNGRQWDLMRIVVAAGDPSLAPGTCVWWQYIGSATPQDTANEPGSFPDLIDQSRALGLLAGYSDDQVTIAYPEHLIVVVKNAPNSTLIQVTAQVKEYALNEDDSPDMRAARGRRPLP